MTDEGVAIEHSPVKCIVAGKYPRLNACFAPSSRLARARVYFRVADGPPGEKSERKQAQQRAVSVAGQGENGVDDGLLVEQFEAKDNEPKDDGESDVHLMPEGRAPGVG